jgi:hypothetical protein
MRTELKKSPTFLFYFILSSSSCIFQKLSALHAIGQKGSFRALFLRIFWILLAVAERKK